MIKGITNTEDGQPIQRLAVSTKVAIGLPPDPKQGRKAPMKLDCFIFLKKSQAAQNAWEIDPKLTKVYGNKCKEFEIVLLDDDLENVFPTRLAWFTASECKCFGDGETATRRTPEHPEGQPWTPCGKTCPDFERGDCKPSGDLRFMLAAFPQLGAVARIHTSSYRSIMQISSSLQQIQTITGGRLAGIRCKLVVRPEKTSYGGSDGKRHSTTIYALNLEIQAEGIKQLVERMTDHARLFEQTRKMLGTGRIEVIESDDARAGEIEPEFYPGEIAPVVFPKPEEADQVVEPQSRPNMAVRCNACGKVNGHASDCKTQKPEQPPAKEAPALCNDCRQTGTHAPDCKYAAKAEQDRLTSKGSSKAVYAVTGVEKKVSTKQGEYLVVSVLTVDNQKGVLYVWHHGLHEHFLRRNYSKPLPMMAEVTQNELSGKMFYQIEHLLELGGVIFVNDEPAEQATAEQAVGEEIGESLFGKEK